MLAMSVVGVALLPPLLLLRLLTMTSLPSTLSSMIEPGPTQHQQQPSIANPMQSTQVQRTTNLFMPN